MSAWQGLSDSWSCKRQCGMDRLVLGHHLNYLYLELNNPKDANKIMKDMELENYHMELEKYLEMMEEMHKASRHSSRL